MVPQAFRPLTWATTGLLASKALHPDYGPQYLTDEGISIPTLTEMRKQSDLSSVGLPIMGSAALVAALGHDYLSRLRSGQPVNEPEAPLHRRVLDQLGAFYADNPALGVLGTLGAYGGVRHALGKFSEYVETLGSQSPQDSVLSPEIDIDDVVTKIGSVLLR